MTHLLTPPPELIQELAKSAGYIISPGWLTYALEKVFQAGADQELEACCEWLKLEGHEHEHEALLAARRPKPPSLKEQALQALNEIEDRHAGPTIQEELIRRALNQLPDN
jgi:hypothetical protein